MSGLASLAVLVALALAPVCADSHVRFWLPGHTYYVSPQGSDSNSGRSEQRPWRTVNRVNNAALSAGDQVLFEGGKTFSGQLEPGHGVTVSGLPGSPIRFGSYGWGRARLAHGIWIGSSRHRPAGPSYLVFENLSLGPVRGFQGTGNDITLRGLEISNLLPPVAHQEIGIQTEGSHWLITGNSISDVGGSGMLLGANADDAGGPAGGQFYDVRGNTITNSGLDPDIDYGTHGIYLKVAHSTITGNHIIGFRDDGISVRYRDATVASNYIADGDIGIGWFQYDRTPGVSRFVGNQIQHMGAAGIFVCGVLEGCWRPIETFRIAGNEIVGGLLRWNLQPTTGHYIIRGAN